MIRLPSLNSVLGVWKSIAGDFQILLRTEKFRGGVAEPVIDVEVLAVLHPANAS